MHLRPLTICLGLVWFCACTGSEQPKQEMQINLYSGIRNFVSLGDTEEIVKKTTRYDFEKREIESQSPSGSLEQMQVSHYLDYRTVGTKAYFRENRVVLIEIQDPFKGKIQGKELDLFSMSKPTKGTWEASLERVFGGPIARASGGHFGAECLFYTWGDISYNRNGPNELALYRDPSISRYRQQNFGRELRLFGN